MDLMKPENANLKWYGMLKDDNSFLIDMNSSELAPGLPHLVFVLRNSSGTKCQEIGLIPRSSAAGIVNFQ